MLTIKTYSDLAKVDSNGPAQSFMKDLFLSLRAAYTSPGHPYRPEEHGFIVLIEEGDMNRPLDLPELPCRLEEVPWENAAKDGQFFHAIYLANNEFGISFVIPDAPWLVAEVRAALADVMP